MTKKDDEATLGKVIASTVASAVRETSREKLTGSAKELNDLLDEVLAQNQPLTVKIWRRGFGFNANSEEFIKPLYNVNPEMLKDSGIEPLIQNYCGGGTYRLIISAPNIPSKQMTTVIAGEPIMPKTDRDVNAAATGASLPPGFPFPMTGPAGMGWNAGAPGAAQYFGLPGSYGQPTTQQPQSQSHFTEMMLLAQMISGAKDQGRSGGAESDEVKAMREQVAEMKAQLAAKEADKARLESERRADAQIIELKMQMEKMAAPKEDTATKMLAMVPVLAPVIAAYFTSRDQAMAAAAQAQREAAQNQMTMMTALMTTQGNASKESIEVFKTMMLQPKESETDRMKGVMDIAMSSMSTTMGLTQAMVNQMASMQPENRPPWMEVLMTIIENAAQMGQAALESRSQKMGDEQPPTVRVEQVRVLKGEGEYAPQGILDAASAAAAAAQDNLGAPQDAGMVEAGAAQMAGLEEEVQLPDFSAGAFKSIFDLISERDDAGNFTGDVHEVAFRLWKHASSGDKEALLWVNNPERYTFEVLDGLARGGYLLVTAERIQEVSEALKDLWEHFMNGGDAQGYVQAHGLSISLPKRIVVVPLTPPVTDEGTPANPPADTSALQDEETAPEPAEAKPPTTPTPSFGQSPPPVVPV